MERKERRGRIYDFKRRNEDRWTKGKKWKKRREEGKEMKEERGGERDVRDDKK